MVRHQAREWQDVTAAHLTAELEGDEFEQFCADLVAFEACDRHPGCHPARGTGKYAQDGGCDLLLTVSKPPRPDSFGYQRDYNVVPLTEDPLPGRPQTRTAYSFKSGKGWFDKILDEARTKAKKPVEVLEEGGYFKLLVAQPGNLDNKVKRGGREATRREHITRAFWERLKRSNPNAPDPGSRIQILDAADLAAFLRGRRPESRMDPWVDRLGLTPVLRSLDDWRAVHVQDREEPRFEEDNARAELRQRLVERLMAEPVRKGDRAVCIVGQPGVGKTRLVLDALQADLALKQRVLVALSPAEAGDALDAGRLLRQHRDAILVIDDCLALEARAITNRFLAAAQEDSRARLVVLVPAAFDAVRSDLPVEQTWHLAPLDVEHTRRVVANEIGLPENDEAVAAIARFSEGFPWFARLLGVEHKRAGRPPRNMREAVRWALASRQEAEGQALEDLRVRRARCLLAASLTRAVDWMSLSPERREQLAHAVSLQDWPSLLDGAKKCEERGLLRRSLGWQFKYVTPQVLEREIVAWLLDPDDGWDPGGRNLSRFGEEYLEEFLTTLTRLGLPPNVLANVADTGLRALRETPGHLQDLGAAGLVGSRLLFVAQHRPKETARELHRRISTASFAELHGSFAERRTLVFALDALASRRETFEDAEHALFLLAYAENESYGNNATAVWSSLFLVELNATYLPLGARLDLLERRMDDTDAAKRLAALGGAEAVLSTHVSRVVREPLDGPWPLPTGDEAHQGRLRAWSMLAERFSDPAPEVASRAKKLAMNLLRCALRLGIGEQVLEHFATKIAGFSSEERTLLRHKLEEIEAYDLRFLQPSGEALARLTGLLAPRTFSERFRLQVGGWGPASGRANDETVDEALAREGLSGEAPLRAELPWLMSADAQRGHVFAYALGRADLQGALLEDIRTLARSNPASWTARSVLARYVAGMAEGGRPEQAEAVLQRMQARADEAAPAALAIAELGATPDHLVWLGKELHAGHIDSATVVDLGRRRGWLQAATDTEVHTLVTALLEGQASAHPAAALEILVDRITKGAKGSPVLREPLVRAMERLAAVETHGMTDHYWELGAKLLVEWGDTSRVAELSVIVIQRPRGSNDYAWNALHRAAERDATLTFHAVARALDRREAGAARLLMAFWFHRQPFAWPVDEVLAWVGDDERRGRAAAGIVRGRGAELPPVMRALIQRFGPYGSVAREIMSRIESTDGMVASLADHDQSQLARARGWLQDPDPKVVAFAKKLVDDLERSHEHHAAYEEDQRRQVGT